MSKFSNLLPASGPYCGQCEILHILHTHSHSERNKTKDGETKVLKITIPAGNKVLVSYISNCLTFIFIFIFILTLSYLQTCPQIRSSNFTVLTLALEKRQKTTLG